MNHYSLHREVVTALKTAWFRVKNEITMSIDRRMLVLLVRQDLSAAFDEVNHNVDVSILIDMFCMCQV